MQSFLSMESDYMFTADSETMKVEVAFTFDATSLDGKQIVTFEELYDLSNPDEPKKVTEHKDIDDEGQTITFKEKPEVPEEPEKPETPQTPEKPNRPSDSPKTGDNTSLYGLLALLMTSGFSLKVIVCPSSSMSLCSVTFFGSSGLLKSYNSSKVTSCLPSREVASNVKATSTFIVSLSAVNV